MWKAGPPLIVIVVLNKREVPKGTLKDILRHAGLSPEQFIALGQAALPLAT